MFVQQPQATIVVPVMNEQDNILPLLERLLAVFVVAGVTAEVIFVDDSSNLETRYAIERAVKVLRDNLVANNILEVRHVHRKGKARKNGLSGSVVEGLIKARAPFVVVMDGDLQHPPEVVPELLREIEKDGRGVVVASRYREGGSSEGLSSPLRHLISRASTRIAKRVFPKALRRVTDPMTGFFALRMSAIDPYKLHPRGFKIMMELLARNPHLIRAEVPLQFGKREKGESKGTVKQGLEFIWHLIRLRLSTLSTVANFAMGGGAIALLGLAMLTGMVRVGVDPVVANTIQLTVTLVLNFLYNWGWTWRGQPRERLFQQMGWFTASRGSTQFINWTVSSVLLAYGWPSLPVVSACLLGTTILNYVTSKRIFQASCA